MVGKVEGPEASSLPARRCCCMGRAPRWWLHEGVSLLHPPELASLQHLSFPRPGLGSAKKPRPAPGRAAESRSQTARRGAAAEEPARLLEPDGSQGPVSHAETAEQEQPPREVLLRPQRAQACKALGQAGWDPFAGSRGRLLQHPHSVREVPVARAHGKGLNRVCGIWQRLSQVSAEGFPHLYLII